MSSALEPYGTIRRLRRTEYDQLTSLGMFTGERLELLDGLMVVREPQGSPHAAIAAQVGKVLTAAFGEAWHARLHSPLALDEDSEPEPDVAIVAGAPRDYIGAHPQTAALVVEVADSSLRVDRLKGGLYARAGIQEYWIVDVAAGVLEVSRAPHGAADAQHGGAYSSVEVLRPPVTVTPLGAPASRIPIADLLP